MNAKKLILIVILFLILTITITQLLFYHIINSYSFNNIKIKIQTPGWGFNYCQWDTINIGADNSIVVMRSGEVIDLIELSESQEEILLRLSQDAFYLRPLTKREIPTDGWIIYLYIDDYFYETTLALIIDPDLKKIFKKG